MAKNKINTLVQLFSYNGESNLNIFVTSKFKADGLNAGYIEVGGSADSNKNCFWDNLEFFQNCTKEEFNKECKKELKEKGFDVGEVRRDIKRLIKRAIKKGLLVDNNKDINFESL